MAQQLENLTWCLQGCGSTPGLTHWVKDLVLPQVVA